MNDFMGNPAAAGGADGLYHAPLLTSEITQPAKTFVFIDEHEDSIDDGSFWNSSVPAGSRTGWADLPASRHNGSATLSFADGHAETKKWLDPRTRKPVERKKFPPTVCPNNPDVLWLRERAWSRME